MLGLDFRMSGRNLINIHPLHPQVVQVVPELINSTLVWSVASAIILYGVVSAIIPRQKSTLNVFHSDTS